MVSKEIETAAAEVGHHLRREAIARNVPSMSRTYRAYSPRLVGEDYRDIRGLKGDHSDLYRLDNYAAAQLFGEQVRSEGKAGIIFDSVRRRGGTNMVAFIPPQITNVMQTEHFEISVEARARAINLRRLRL